MKTWNRRNASPGRLVRARRTCGRPRLRAFTLIEMLVSIAVLGLALSIVGVVFAITAKTASQAAAYAEVHNHVRQFLQQIAEDLEYVDPSQSMLVLVGRTQPAALTQTDLEVGRFHRVLVGDPTDPSLSGYDPNEAPGLDLPNNNYSDPRADLLMFVTNRPAASIAPPTGPPDLTDPLRNGYKLSPALVVYGHAALAKARWAGTQYQFPPVSEFRHLEETVNVNGRELSELPANRWHLSRRASIIHSVPGVKYTLDNTGNNNEWDRLSRCVGDTGTTPYNTPKYGDVADLNLQQFLADVDGLAATFPPYKLQSQWTPQIRINILSLLYASANQTYHHVATVLEEVPTELASNLGVQMLPGCAWFQVEFLMPEDPRNSAYYSSPDPTSFSMRSDSPHWTMVQPHSGLSGGSPATYVFVPDTQTNRAAVADTPGISGVDSSGQAFGRLAEFGRLDPNVPLNQSAVQNRIIRLWPYAIRVTIRVYDSRGRLPEPIVRSIVHRFE